MAVVEVTEDDAEDRIKWRWKIRCGDPTGKAKRRRSAWCVSGLLYVLASQTSTCILFRALGQLPPTLVLIYIISIRTDTYLLALPSF